jgi:SAM-dependent methyltransferase
MVESPIIFDRLLWRRRRHRAAVLPPATFLLERVAAELADRLSTVLRRFELVLDLGTPGDAVRAALRGSDSVGSIVAADVFARDKPFVVADEEALPFGGGTIDLVVSALALQFVNDLPGVFLQIRRALKPDGLFLAALFGGDTLTELRQSFAAAESEIEGGASPHVAPFVDLRELGVWGRPTHLPRAGGRRCAGPRSCAWRKFMRSVSPTPMGASGPRSTSFGSRGGRRIRISSSRSSLARPGLDLPTRSARARSRQARRPVANARSA